MKKISTLLFVLVPVQGCSTQDITAEAKSCVADQLGQEHVINKYERDVVARHCDSAFRHWALASTQHAYGPAFDVNDPAVRREYRLRKQAILWNLMPLDGDPVRM